MPKVIAKTGEYYMEWSTTTDSPTTFGMRHRLAIWLQEIEPAPVKLRYQKMRY